MFSFALWDKKNKNLTLAKDRLGEKPMYYGFNEGIFFFGSDLRSFKLHPKFNPEIDRNSLALFIKYNFIPTPSSIYKGIYKLPSGSFLIISEKHQEMQVKKYWNIHSFVNDEDDKKSKITEVEYIEKLDLLLNKTVSKQMLSDVPIGAFLSGGIDSSTIVSLMQANSSKKINTFTIGFDEFGYNESKNAKNIAKILGTNHNETILSSKKAIEIIPDLPSIYSEPFADSSQIPTYLVSKIAREKVKVALSGDGGDELFGGYNRYVLGKRMWDKISFFPLILRKVMANSINIISPETYNSIYNRISNFLSSNSAYINLGDKLHKGSRVMIAKDTDELYNFFISQWGNPFDIVNNKNSILSNNIILDQNAKSDNFVFKMMLTDTLNYLPDDILCKVDRAAMANSLETRLPLLDHHVVSFAMQIPMNLKLRDNVGKWILRQVLYKYLPKELVDRPKMGFGIPLGKWLRGPLNEWAEDLLSKKSITKNDYFNFKPIHESWNKHKSGKSNLSTSLWGILMFQEWLSKQ